MDRLSALTLVALLACGKGDEPAPPPSRVEGAKTSAPKKADTEAFCDFHAADDKGPALAFPPLAGGAQAPVVGQGHWRWLNVWATWCKPCVEEMPRIAKWREKLGSKIDLAFVSVDEKDDDIATFRKAHGDAPESVRLADPAKQTDWFKQLGLDAGSPIPIHVFVSPAGHIRCARAGGVREADFPAIERLLAE
jgi:thiol-disulfide isomerase/thioredoxin